MTKTYNNYEDLLTFTRASKGHALRPVSYGTEVVTNGDFATDSDWTKSGGSTISSGEGHIVSTGSFVSLIQNIGAVTGKIYFVTIDVTVNSGAGVYIGIGGGAVDSRRYDATYTGTHSFALVAGPNDTNVQITRSGPTDSDVDNISIKEVTFDESDGTLTLFEHPNNIPRVEWDAQRNRLGLLVEEARTNLVPSSGVEDWTNVSYATTEPITETTLGAFTGKTVISQNQTWHRIQSPAFSVTSGTTYAVTVFYKAGTSGQVYIDLRIPTNSTVIKGTAGALTVSSNSAGTGTILSQETLPDDVYKVVFTVAANATASNAFIGIGPNSTTVGETVIALAAQCEQASFGTSYMKTTGSTATRSADVASIPVADFGFNANAGSLLVQCQHFTTETGATAAAAVAIDDGSSSNRMWYYQNKGQWIGSSGGAMQFSITGGDLAEDTEVKAGMVYSKDDFALYIDGSSVGTDTSGSVAEGVTTLHVGDAGGATVPLNGHIKSIKYYPRRLTNAQLQEITT